ncbi:LysE family translocator [Pseudoalteromonas tunicata]|uniref:LysE family translocator n=1 Tax=Pseudoalteromonas tunicata TaxID=314281 RepID=UPI00273F68C8|nr:LysE family translocator [Pseudoalteromonas tunicata]MDP4984884.1 LysE family translocator [Pseudoalteromonas tunicata]
MNELIALLLPLMLFSISATATPGPNNVMLTLLGSEFGLKSALGFIAGIRMGIVLLFALMSMGVAGLVELFPHSLQVLKCIGAVYLFWLAIKLIKTTSQLDAKLPVNPLGFVHGMAVQFINPKSILMVLSCISAFSLPNHLYWYSVLQACAVFSVVGLLTNIGWTLFGVAVSRLLATPVAKHRFNCFLAACTFITIGLIFV